MRGQRVYVAPTWEAVEWLKTGSTVTQDTYSRKARLWLGEQQRVLRYDIFLKLLNHGALRHTAGQGRLRYFDANPLWVGTDRSTKC